MNVNENNDINAIQNQEVYEGIREAMLQEGVIPREITKEMRNYVYFLNK